MAQSSSVSAGQDATAQQYNNLRADLFSAHHQDPAGIKIVNADIDNAAAISFSKLAALTANRALVTNGSGVIAVSGATATEIGYLSGIVSRPVSNSGDETINGVKTFGSIPILPAANPISDNQAVRKLYADTYYEIGIIPALNVTLTNNCDDNYDTVIAVGFQPRIIKLHYSIWAIGNGYIVFSQGTAIFRGATLIANLQTYPTGSRTGGGGTYPLYPNTLTDMRFMLDGTTHPIDIGVQGGAFWATDWRHTFSMLSIQGNGFTLRSRVRASSSVSGPVSNIVRGSWEAYR